MHKLEEFENVRRSQWGTSIQQAYSKRTYLFERMKYRARLVQGESSFSEKLKIAAQRMDDERGARTMPQYLTFLKGNDPGVRSRKKRRVPASASSSDGQARPAQRSREV